MEVSLTEMCSSDGVYFFLGLWIMLALTCRVWVGKVIDLGFMMFDLLVCSWSFRHLFSIEVMAGVIVDSAVFVCSYSLTWLLIVLTSYVLIFLIIILSDLVCLIG